MNKKILFVSILAVLLMVSMSFVSTLDAAYVKQKSITLNKQEANYDDLEQIPSGYGLLTRVTATGVGPWPNFGGAGKPKVGCTVLYPHVELDTGYFLLDGSKLEAPVTIEMAYFIGYWTLSPTNSECRIYMKGFGFGVQIRGMQQENNQENTQETPQDITPNPTETNTPTNNNNEQTEEYNINPTPTPTYPDYNPTPEPEPEEKPERESTNDFIEDEVVQQPEATPPRINSGKIEVYVLSSKGGPISGATVRVSAGYRYLPKTKTTGFNGIAVFDNLPIGVIPIGYSVTAYKPGYIVVNGGKWWNPKLSSSNPEAHVTITLTPTETNTPANNNNQQPQETTQNQAPSVLINGPSSGTTGQTLSFSSSASDPAGSITRYDWYYKGSWHDNIGSSISISFPTTGTKTVKVKVYDNDGATNIATRSVSITSSGSSSSSSSSPSSSSGSPSSSSGGGTAL